MTGKFKATTITRTGTSGGTLDITLIPTSLFDQVAAGLGLTPNPDAGVVSVDFYAAMPIDGGFGASLNLAHDRTFTVTAGVPAYADAGTAGPGNGNSLIFPNAATGTTGVMFYPPSGYSCTLPPPTTIRVDPDTFTYVLAVCQ